MAAVAFQAALFDRRTPQFPSQKTPNNGIVFRSCERDTFESF